MYKNSSGFATNQNQIARPIERIGISPFYYSNTKSIFYPNISELEYFSNSRVSSFSLSSVSFFSMLTLFNFYSTSY
jgi:hypothetical protein